MTSTRDRTAETRAPLNRERVLQAAVELADRDGLESLSMRKLGAELGVEAMSLYNHVANKDDLLDGIVDAVATEFQDPRAVDATDWRAILRQCAMAEHEALLRHRWAPALSESRVLSGPKRLAYYDALLGVLREAGFSDVGAYRVNLVLDSYVYGFTLQEVSWPASAGESELAAALIDGTMEDTYPNLVATAQLAANGQIDIGVDFEVGLDALLDSLERIREIS